MYLPYNPQDPSYLVKKMYTNACVVGDSDTILSMIKNENKEIKNKRFLNECINNACKHGHETIFDTILNYVVESTDINTLDFDDIICNACIGGNIRS